MLLRSYQCLGAGMLAGVSVTCPGGGCDQGEGGEEVMRDQGGG